MIAPSSLSNLAMTFLLARCQRGQWRGSRAAALDYGEREVRQALAEFAMTDPNWLECVLLRRSGRLHKDCHNRS